MKKCYKIVLERDNKYYSTNLIFNFNPIIQEYFKDKTNFPKNENSDIFVFKDVYNASIYALYNCLGAYEIWECSCPSVRSVYPHRLFSIKYTFDSYIEHLKSFWIKVKETRRKKKIALFENYDTMYRKHYTTQYIKFLKVVKKTNTTGDILE